MKAQFTDKDNIIYLSGELSFTTVSLLNKSGRGLIGRKPKVVFDLSQVTFSDNAGVSLLVALAGYAKKLGKDIEFVNLPRQLLELLTAVKVKDILPVL